MKNSDAIKAALALNGQDLAGAEEQKDVDMVSDEEQVKEKKEKKERKRRIKRKKKEKER